MKGNVRSLLRKYCLESTILGLKYFYLFPDRISRCFWLANMLAVLFLACLLSWLLYCRFEEMPTRTTIENQYEPAENLPYPAITLCSPNQITLNFMRHFNRTLINGNLTINLEKVLPQLLGFYELLKVNENDLNHLQSLLDLNRYTVSDIMSGAPQSCDSFLKMCFFEHQKYDCAKLFTPLLTAHGLCCAFNNVYHYKDRRNVHNRDFIIKNVTRAGINDGLIVVADYNPDNAIDRTILNAGATKVMYNDFSEYPADEVSSLIEPNAESYHMIHATHTYCSDDVKALPQWSRQCYLEDEHQLQYFEKYHNSDCDLTCYALAVRDACHCTLFFMPRLKPDRICNLTSIRCIMNVKIHMSEWSNSDQCDCPRDCESRNYKVDMIIGNFDAMPHMIYNPYKEMKLNKSSSIMYFYFPIPQYVKQKQETVMSIISFVSNLGGVFGLCLGCSVISVLEITFYTYVAIRNHIRRKFRLTQVKNYDYYKN